MQKKSNNTDWKLQLLGWLLFGLSAVFFVIASIRNGDIISFLGGLFFYAACVAFVIPCIKTKDTCDKL